MPVLSGTCGIRGMPFYLAHLPSRQLSESALPPPVRNGPPEYAELRSRSWAASPRPAGQQKIPELGPIGPVSRGRSICNPGRPQICGVCAADLCSGTAPPSAPNHATCSACPVAGVRAVQAGWWRTTLILAQHKQRVSWRHRTALSERYCLVPPRPPGHCKRRALRRLGLGGHNDRARRAVRAVPREVCCPRASNRVEGHRTCSCRLGGPSVRGRICISPMAPARLTAFADARRFFGLLSRARNCPQ